MTKREFFIHGLKYVKKACLSKFYQKGEKFMNSNLVKLLQVFPKKDVLDAVLQMDGVVGNVSADGTTYRILADCKTASPSS
jgi:hypothetical protein